MQYRLKDALNYIKVSDILHIFALMFVLPWALIAKVFYRGVWLICEDRNEARDNGYWLFKWICENRPKQKVMYAINKKSPDFEKVKSLGKIISYGSLSHWFWYIVADKNISSQKGGKPNAAICYFFEVVLKMRKNNRVFLQHGVTKDKADWLFYKNTYVRLFVTSARPEHEYITDEFGYPPGFVRLCGMARFDALHDCKTDNDLILAMPTWRNWLGRESRNNRLLEFGETEYCKRWNDFLQDKRLEEILEKYNKRLIFYPHRNMQKFLGYFTSNSSRIEIADWRKYDIQEVLKTAALMITDYSSVFFDFAYMKKPVVFYQFDEAEFREKQYTQGYFDYHNNTLGKWSGELDCCLDIVEDLLQSDCPANDRVTEFFELYDKNNCERIYYAIKNLNKNGCGAVAQSGSLGVNDTE